MSAVDGARGDGEIWRRNPEVLSRSLAGISVLLRPADGETIKLQSLASLVWLGLEVPGTVVEIADDIAAIAGDADSSEVRATIRELADLNVVARG